MSAERNSDRNSIQVIGRAAEVLRLLAEETQGLSLTEIAKRTDLARSTIQRIVKALSDEEFVEINSERGGVTLGQGLFRLAAHNSVDVAQIAQPFLRELAREVDETVDLSVLTGRSAIFVEHIAGAHRLAALSAIGTEFPLHSTANGKAMLSCLPPEQQNELLSGALSLDTPHTVTDASKLHEQLRHISRSGLAFDLEEHTEGICAVGTAFLDPTGKPFAISIPVPRQRFDAKRAELEGPLLACRSKLVTKLNGTLPREMA